VWAEQRQDALRKQLPGAEVRGEEEEAVVAIDVGQ
jgi:hypothetical protein